MGFETNANYCPWSQDLGPNEPALTDRALNGLQRVLEGGHCGGQGMGQAVSGIGAIGMHERFEGLEGTYLRCMRRSSHSESALEWPARPRKRPPAGCHLHEIFQQGCAPLLERHANFYRLKPFCPTTLIYN